MANVFSHNIALSERDVLATKYRNARIDLLVVALATLLNVILAATTSDSYFLFSATIPYILTFYSALLCGLYPAEYYEGLGAVNVLPMGVFFACLAISLIIIGLYVLAFFLSGKNRAGWMIFALVLFCLDTLTLFLYAGVSLDWLLDYIFHIWVIVILALGLRAHAKLKKLPPAASAPVILQGENGEIMTFESASSETPPFENANSTTEDSVPLRSADMSVKQKVLLEATVNGKGILYRRVKRTNELVINGQVYDEYVALAEMPHTLAAIVDGHLYEAGYNTAHRSFIAVDGQEIASKLRLI